MLTLLHSHPDLINSASEAKGYTALHQAAWHGASPAVVGALLARGANPSLRTNNKGQTAREIAAERLSRRFDLQFLLFERGRTMAQLMRKIAAETPDLFTAYDGNQVLFDRLIDGFGADSCCQSGADFDKRLAAAFTAVTGESLVSTRPISCGPNNCFELHIDPNFWADRFAVLLRALASRACCIPIEKHWAVVSDLFDPAPEGWGLRGDVFLWMEMRQALGHVPIPEQPEAIAGVIASAFAALTGQQLDAELDVNVPRFSRGGMSSGMVSGQFWSEKFIPTAEQRGTWLKESWGNYVAPKRPIQFE